SRGEERSQERRHDAENQDKDDLSTRFVDKRRLGQGLRTITQRCDARKLLPLEQFKRCAAAGGDEGYPVGQASLLHRCDGIAATDDGSRARASESLSDRDRARSERRNFENSDRTVPKDCFRFGDFVLIKANRRMAEID